MSRMRKAKDGELISFFGKKYGESDVYYDWGKGCAGADARLVNYVLSHVKIPNTDNKNLLEELADRGYDLSTLRFSIKKLNSNQTI